MATTSDTARDIPAISSPSATILLAEDDASINDVICKRLSKERYCVCPAFSGTEAKMLLEARDFDLVITDLMLPGIEGDELVISIRESDARIPIIVISARTSTSDKVDLLTLGADDYLAKPFDLDELAARVKAQLRKSALASQAESEGSPLCGSDPLAIEIGCLYLDPSQRKLTVSGEEISLTRTEFDMVHLMMAHPKKVFTKQELYQHVWNEPYPDQENSVNAHISNIRAKLRSTAAEGCIQTVWGIGFKLEP